MVGWRPLVMFRNALPQPGSFSSSTATTNFSITVAYGNIHKNPAIWLIAADLSG